MLTTVSATLGVEKGIQQVRITRLNASSPDARRTEKLKDYRLGSDEGNGESECSRVAGVHGPHFIANVQPNTTYLDLLLVHMGIRESAGSTCKVWMPLKACRLIAMLMSSSGSCQVKWHRAVRGDRGVRCGDD